MSIEHTVEGIEEFIRRLIFSALIGNADTRLKNGSLIYPGQRQVVLSPGYDFVSTIVYIDKKWCWASLNQKAYLIYRLMRSNASPLKHGCLRSWLLMLGQKQFIDLWTFGWREKVTCHFPRI